MTLSGVIGLAACLILLALIVVRALLYCPHCGDRLKYKKGPERSMFFCMSCGYAHWDKKL